MTQPSIVLGFKIYLAARRVAHWKVCKGGGMFWYGYTALYIWSFRVLRGVKVELVQHHFFEILSLTRLMMHDQIPLVLTLTTCNPK